MFWKKKPSVLVLGSDGMLGTDVFEMLRTATLDHESGIGYVYGMGRSELESYGILKRHGLGDFMRTNRKFDICVNCIAMTDTASAENTKDGKDLSYRLNALLPMFLAESCSYWKTKLVHISTDYVFGGDRTDHAYTIDDSPFPTNVYGEHKLLGEKLIECEFSKKDRQKNFAILRTSWLYGKANSKSFIHKFIANAVRASDSGKDNVDVTENEISVPTSTKFLSTVIIDDFIKKWSSGVFHAVPSGKPISRAEWASRILDLFHEYGCNNKLTKLNKDFVHPVVRIGLYNPEYSALEPTILTSSAFLHDADEWLKSFIHDNGKTICKAIW